MIKNLIDKSIKTALNCDWKQAIAINQQILKRKPDHVATLNRLAFAYREDNQLAEAIETYNKVLVLDKYNAIAKKHLAILTSGKLQRNGATSQRLINLDFVDEPGRTKTLPLTRLGDPKLLDTLQAGQVVKLVLKNHYVCVYTNQDEHIGALTDDMAFQLKTFLQAGNTYQAIIKCTTTQHVQVFLREMHRAAAYKDTASLAM